MNRTNMGSNLLLGLAALIWGVAFVAQSVGMEYVEPFTFNGCRFLIGGAVLLPLIWAMSGRRQALGEGVDGHGKNQTEKGMDQPWEESFAEWCCLWPVPFSSLALRRLRWARRDL